jgi:hypothetical protein
VLIPNVNPQSTHYTSQVKVKWLKGSKWLQGSEEPHWRRRQRADTNARKSLCRRPDKKFYELQTTLLHSGSRVVKCKFRWQAVSSVKWDVCHSRRNCTWAGALGQRERSFAVAIFLHEVYDKWPGDRSVFLITSQSWGDPSFIVPSEGLYLVWLISSCAWCFWYDWIYSWYNDLLAQINHQFVPPGVLADVVVYLYYQDVVIFFCSAGDWI